MSLRKAYGIAPLTAQRVRQDKRQRRNRQNTGIASLHYVSLAMTNKACVSPD